MLVTLLCLATAVGALITAVLNWRARAKSNGQRRRLVFAICAAGFVAVAIAEACIAVWH
jgi:hypothetical protein